MSLPTPETHFIDTFRSNVFHLAQKKASQLIGNVRKETQNARIDHYDYYGTASAPQEITSKFSKTEFGTVSNGRRACFITDYDHALPVWKQDKLRMIHEPENEYSVAMRNAWGRFWDAKILTSMLADAREGDSGTTIVAHPNSQKLVAHDGSTTTGVRLNSRTLTRLNTLITDASVEGEMIFIGAAADREGMLSDDKIINGDYNTIKALVDGKIDSYQGFRFIWMPTSELHTYSGDSLGNVTYNVTTGVFGSGTGTVQAAKARRCVAYEKSAIVFAVAAEMEARVDERADLRYMKQIYMKMTFGGTRLEDTRVFEVITADV